MLILGHRYGFAPADGNPGGLSITHLEFRRAGECGIPRIALLRTSIPDVRLSDLEDPARAALVLAFRAEVARQVRLAEFSDLQGLIQGLSTGIQGELDKQDTRDGPRTGHLRAGACRPRMRSLALSERGVLEPVREQGLLAEDFHAGGRGRQAACEYKEQVSRGSADGDVGFAVAVPDDDAG